MKSAPSTYRQYQRMPASLVARRYHTTTNKLYAELSMPEPERTFIEPPGKYSGVWLVGAFLLGGAFWIGICAAFM